MSTTRAQIIGIGLSAFLFASCSQPAPTNKPAAESPAVASQTQPRETSRPAIQAAWDKELQTAKRLYEEKEREIEAFQRHEALPAKDGNIANETLATLRALVTELEVDMLGKKAQWEVLEKVRPEDLPITADLQQLVSADPGVVELDQKRTAANDKYQALEARYGPNHRLVKESKAQRDEAARQAETERSAKILKYNTQQIEQSRRNYLESQEQLTKLKERLFAAEQENRDKVQSQQRYQKLLEERDLLKSQYERIQEQKRRYDQNPTPNPSAHNTSNG